NARERAGEIVCNRPLNLTDEAQREVQLLVRLPTKVGAVVHRVDQEIADRFGRADSDGHAVHGGHLPQAAARWDGAVSAQLPQSIRAATRASVWAATSIN